MDRVLLQKKQAQYADRALRVDQYLIERAGLVKNRTYLKIEDYVINCVPYEISLSRWRVISVLGPDEISFFGEYSGSTHNLHLTIDNPIFGREFAMFAKVRLGSLKQHNPESRVCLIDLTFVSLPNDLAEVMVALFDELDRTRAAYDRSAAEAIETGLEHLYPLWPYRYARVERNGEELVPAARIIALAPHQIRLFADFLSSPPEAHTEVDVVFAGSEGTPFLKGTIAELKASKEVPQCYITTVTLEYVPAFVERVIAATPQTKKSDDEDDESGDGTSAGTADGNAVGAQTSEGGSPSAG